MHVGEVRVEAGIPALPTLRVLAGQVGDVLDRGAEARGTDHRAVGAGQAAAGDVVPARRFLMESGISARRSIGRHLAAHPLRGGVYGSDRAEATSAAAAGRLGPATMMRAPSSLAGSTTNR